MKKIIAKTKLRNYPLIIDNNIFARKERNAGKLVSHLFNRSERIVLVTNDKILSIYKIGIDKFLKNTGIDYKIISISDGEKEKNLKNTEKIYQGMLKFNVHINDLLVAFGGGVIGDIGGFAASTFHRGINICHFPTTIISQVDSSMGGKVVVNLNDFKNIIGSFYQPHAIITDPQLLLTLEEKEIINGLAEIVKYGIVFDKRIISLLLNIMKKIKKSSNNRLFELIKHRSFIEIIYSCCKIKTRIVSKDEFDKNVRNLLNFGHTFGHAIEKVSGLKDINHGMAVAMGMIIATDISIKLGIAKKELLKEIIELYKILKLPYILPSVDTKNILNAIKFDKKFTATKNKYILIRGINRPFFYYDIDKKIIEESIKENMSGE